MANRSFGYTFHIRDMFSEGSRRVRDSIGEIDRSMNRLGATTGRANAAASRANTGVVSLGRNFRALAGAYVGAQTFRHILRETATVEDGFNKVMSLIRDPADQRAYAEKIRAIVAENQKLGLSAATISDALALQVQTMGANSDSFATFRSGVKLSVAAFMPLEQSLESVNKLMENFSQLGGDSTRAAQLLFTTRQMSNDFEGILAALPAIAPISARAGLTPERSLALMAMLSGKTKSTQSAAGVQVDLMSKLVDHPAVMKQLGLAGTLKRLHSIGSQDPTMLDKIGISGATQRVILTLKPEDFAKLDSLEKTLAADVGSGSMGEAFARAQSSLSSEMNQTKEALNGLAATLGNEIAPPLRVIANYLQTTVPAVSGGVKELTAPTRRRGQGVGSPLGDILFGMPMDFFIGAFKAAQGKPARVEVVVGTEKGATARATATGSADLDAGVQVR